MGTDARPPSRAQWRIFGALVGIFGCAVVAIEGIASMWPAHRAPRESRVVESTSLTAASVLTAPLPVANQIPKRPHRVAPTAKTAELRPVSAGFPSADELRSRWAVEADDAEWSGNASEFLQAMLEVADAGAPNFSTRCKETVCRVEFDGDSSDALFKLQRTPSLPPYSFERLNGDAGSFFQLYFARDG
jgi:hypothetical protein